MSRVPLFLQPIITFPVNSGQGDSIKVAFDKCNSNFRSIEDELIPQLLDNLTVTFNGGNISDDTVFESNTASTSYTTGAVTIGGGMGIYGNVNAFGSVTGSSIIGNSLTGTLATAVQPNITTVGTLGNLVVSGSINADSITVNDIDANGTITVSSLNAGLVDIDDLAVNNSITASTISATASASLGNLTASGQTTLEYLDVTNFSDFTGNVRMTGPYINITSTANVEIYTPFMTLAGSGRLSGGIVSPNRLAVETNYTGVTVSNTDPKTDAIYGEIRFDRDYLYICVSRNPIIVWKRIPLDSF